MEETEHGENEGEGEEEGDEEHDVAEEEEQEEWENVMEDCDDTNDDGHDDIDGSNSDDDDDDDEEDFDRVVADEGEELDDDIYAQEGYISWVTFSSPSLKLVLFSPSPLLVLTAGLRWVGLGGCISRWAAFTRRIAFNKVPASFPLCISRITKPAQDPDELLSLSVEGYWELRVRRWLKEEGEVYIPLAFALIMGLVRGRLPGEPSKPAREAVPCGRVDIEYDDGGGAAAAVVGGGGGGTPKCG
ncbi:hypothetical protein F5I97DRAFT_2071507 [Phlebopus sp. FC_14]|nr:hypothetical protein F5I97DRAFT_2071507 [Phlebopus sp. FC_14]